MALSEEIQAVVTRILVDKTLSVEALDAVKAVTVENTKLQAQVKDLTATVESLNKQGSDQSARLTLFQTESTLMHGREQAVAAREKSVVELEKKAAVAEAVANTVNVCFDKVFRNIQVHRSVTSSVPVPVTGSRDSIGFVAASQGSEFSTETPG